MAHSKNYHQPRTSAAQATDSGPASAKKLFHLPIRIIVPALLLPAVIIYYWPLITARGYIWNDFIEQNFPYRLFVSVWMKKGVFPFWNPYVFSGMPFFADIQTAVLYPFNLMLIPFASNEWLSPLLFEYQIVAHFLLGGFFMYACARDFNLARLPALAAAIIFIFSAFLPLHIFHVNSIHSAAWFPLIILCTKRMLERSSLLYCCASAFALSMSCFAGYPQLLMHMYYFIAAWFLFFCATAIAGRKPPKALLAGAALFAMMILLSAGMSAVQLLPTFELGAYSSRPTLSFTESCEGSFRLYRFITLVVPNFFGRPENTYWGLSAADANAGAHYFWETAMYCGIVPLILSFLAFVFNRKPAVWFFGAVGAIALLLAMGDSFFLYGIFFKLAPMFDRFRTPARFAFIFSVSVSICAAFGLQWLMESGASGPRKRRDLVQKWCIIIGAAGIGAALLVTAGALKSWIMQFLIESQPPGVRPQALAGVIDNEIYPYCIRWVWFAALMLAAASAVIVLRLRGMLDAKRMAAAGCVLIFTELIVFGYGYAAAGGPRNDPSAVFAKTPVIKELQRQSQQEYFRINSRDSRPGTTDLGGRHMAFHKNQGSVHGLFLTEGYNPLRLKRQLTDRHPKILDILNVKYTIRVDEAAGSMGFALNETMLPRARMVYDYIVQTDGDSIFSTLKNEAFDHVNTVILEEKPSFEPDTAGDAAPGAASIKRYGLNELDIDVETPRQGLLVLSEIHYPAWKASAGAIPLKVYRADYALRAIEVPAGRHSVRCYYESAAFRTGRYISILSVLIAAGLTAAMLGRRKKTTKAAS